MSILGAALGGALSGAFQMGAEKLRFENEKRLAAQQNQFNLDMWKMQADYNSPQAQMQRFKAAGLNPYLVASQGNAGNMSNAPEMVTPSAPNYSKGAAALGQIFNIEGLKTLVANRKKAQADARKADYDADNALVNMNRNSDEYHAETVFNTNYLFDPNTGKYVFNPLYGKPIRNHDIYYRRRANKLLPSVYMHPYRSALLSEQRSYLVPQIQMAKYEAQHYPITYWVGTAGKGVKAVSDLTGIFNPSRYLMPLSNKVRGYVTPTGRVLNY